MQFMTGPAMQITPASFFGSFGIGHFALTALCIKGYNQPMRRDIITSEMFYAFERWSINGTV